MKKNRLFRIFILLALALTLTLTLSATACGSGNGDESSTPESGSSAAPEYPEIDYLSLDLSSHVTLGQYKGLSISIEKKPVITDEDVMDKLNSDLIYSGYTEKVTDRAVTKDDTVSISFVGLLDGVAFQGGTGNKDNFTIYDGGGFIDGFADGLIGAMPGVETDVNVVFPEKYHSADLAGKPAVFKVTVHHIYEAKELTDEIANELTKGDHKTAESLIGYYRERLNKENDESYEETRQALVWNKIFAGIVSTNIPEEMVNSLYEYELYWAQYYADMYKVSLETYLSADGYTKESLRESIKNNIITNMVIYSIMKAENITLSEDEYKSFIEDSGYTEEQWLKQYSREELEDMFLYTKTYNEAVKWQSFTEIETGTK